MNEEDRKEKIAETFKKHFNHYGFKKTSVDEIAKELNISKKTIYQFFDSKEKIFFYIISKVAKHFKSEMEKKLGSFETFGEKLEQLLNMIFEETRKWLQTNDAFEFKFKYEIASMAFQDAYRELIIKLIESGMNNNEFKAGSAELQAQFIQGIISESMKIQSANKTSQIGNEAIRSIFKLLK